MTLEILIAWIVGVTSFTLLGSYYAKIYKRSDLLISLYITFTLISQILAVKISSFNLGFAEFNGPSGVILFSVTYLFTDIVNEKFGKKETQKMIFFAFVAQLAMIFFLWMSIKLTPSSFWNLQEVWSEIFGIVPRISIASLIAFLITENFDAYTYDWFKKKTKGKHLWTRNVFSSIPALLLDSLIFIPIAFWGILPLQDLIIGQTAVKWLVGIINVPFMYLNKAILGNNK